jgi:hypothetical protein
VASITWVVHDFVKPKDNKLCRMRFEGGEAVAKVFRRAVEDGAGKVAYREDC